MNLLALPILITALYIQWKIIFFICKVHSKSNPKNNYPRAGRKVGV